MNVNEARIWAATAPLCNSADNVDPRRRLRCICWSQGDWGSAESVASTASLLFLSLSPRRFICFIVKLTTSRQLNRGKRERESSSGRSTAACNHRRPHHRQHLTCSCSQSLVRYMVFISLIFPVFYSFSITSDLPSNSGTKDDTTTTTTTIIITSSECRCSVVCLFVYLAIFFTRTTGLIGFSARFRLTLIAQLEQIYER